MELENLPPPANVHTDIPDYYLGCLLYYDEFGDDNCRWVVYDGQNRVRCPTRSEAIDYITSTRLERSENVERLIVSARILLNKAVEQLREAARISSNGESLVFERISARLRPFIVDLDNKILK